jgi:hypothetical protein
MVLRVEHDPTVVGNAVPYLLLHNAVTGSVALVCLARGRRGLRTFASGDGFWERGTLAIGAFQSNGATTIVRSSVFDDELRVALTRADASGLDTCGRFAVGLGIIQLSEIVVPAKAKPAINADARSLAAYSALTSSAQLLGISGS